MAGRRHSGRDGYLPGWRVDRDLRQARPGITDIDLLRFGEFRSVDYPRGANEEMIVDVAILSDQTAIIIQERTNGGIPLLRRFNLNTLESVSFNSVGPNSVLSHAVLRVSGRSDVLVTEPLGEFGIARSVGFYQTAGTTIGDNPVPQAMTAGLIAVGQAADRVSIFDDGLNFVTTLNSISLGTVRELAFSGDGRFLHVLGQNGGTLFTVRTSDWSLVNAFATGLQLPEGANVPVTLLADPRGQFFTVQAGTNRAFTVLENPLAAAIEGTMFPEELTGTLFGDDIFGFGGDDTINAGDGADFIHAG